mgnify:CR=1 FL=1
MAIYQEREDDLESELNKGALWAVTYGDLMSYLMIFFLTVLAFTVSNIQDYDQLVKQMKKQFGDLTEEEIRIELSKKEDTLAEQLAKLLGKDQVSMNEEKVKMTFANPVLFDFGKADLKPSAQEVLVPLAEVFKKVPNNIIIEGHSDNRPIYKLRFQSNFELSAARAYAVISFLGFKEWWIGFWGANVNTTLHRIELSISNNGALLGESSIQSLLSEKIREKCIQTQCICHQ